MFWLTAVGRRLIADSSALINYVLEGSNEARSGRLRQLRRLISSRSIVVPESVSLELQERGDDIGIWLRENPEVALKESNENLEHLGRVMSVYGALLTTRRAADCVVVALAIRMHSDGFGVLADDQGIAAACFREGIHHLSARELRKLEGIRAQA